MLLFCEYDSYFYVIRQISKQGFEHTFFSNFLNLFFKNFCHFFEKIFFLFLQLFLRQKKP